jgi:hypothetical protein
MRETQKHGTYTVQAEFVGNAKYLASSSSQPYAIGP